MRVKYNFILVGIGAITSLFIFSSSTYAANCGGAVVCACGDTVTSSTTLTTNLTCTGHGLTVGAHNITIDGNSHTITGDGGSSDYGINNSEGYNNVIIKNFLKVYNFGTGIYFSGSSTSTIQNNIISSSTLGVFLQSGINLSIEDNNISNGGYGVSLLRVQSSVFSRNYLSNNEIGIYSVMSRSNNYIDNSLYSNNNGINLEISSNSNTLTGNIIRESVRELYDISSGNVYTNNQFLYGIGTTSAMVSFTEKIRLANINETVTSTISLFNINGTSCSDCSYSIALSPRSDSLTTNKADNQLFNYFVPTRTGIYSLSILVVDSNNNTSKKDFVFFVGDANSYVIRYYFRGIKTTHGQPIGSGSDAKSLSFTTPSIIETWNCADWIQNSPDIIPFPYPISNLSSIDTYSWYRTSAVGYIGAQRFVSYDNNVDASSSISATTTYTWANKTLSTLNWSMDTPQSWYWLALKLKGTNPSWQTTPAQPSYADFTYQYTTTPAIKSISNTNVYVLSATAPSTATTSASIVLENPLTTTTSTTLTLSSFSHPFTSASNTIFADATTTVTVSVPAHTTKTLDAVLLTPSFSSGSLDITISSWQSTIKEWIISSSNVTTTTFTIGDLLPSSSYRFKVDGVVPMTMTGPTCDAVGVCTTDDAGTLSVTYTGGYSSHAMRLEHVATTTPATSSNTSGGRSLLLLSALSPTTATSSYTFTTSLSVGMTHPEVKYLQQYLNTHGFPLTTQGTGSFGHETSFFGALTKRALIKFQDTHLKEILDPVGLTKGTGYFGSSTRAYVNMYQ
ncbi:MAG: right-handed parallel beta-helix repeat-containing protein [Candidatus Pacebacteria bacterium]|nr:right-handed parallel beta-helix repeat-containing protein [Candidatus Paceibacterota bacterium]